MLICHTLQHHTVLPTSPVPVHALSFCPHPSVTHATSPSSRQSSVPLSSSVLVLAHADNSLTIFDVEARRYPDWAAHLCSREKLPKRFRGLHDPVLGITFDLPRPHSSDDIDSDPIAGSSHYQRNAYMWGATWICRVTLDAPAGWGGFIKKRARDEQTHGNGKKKKKHPASQKDGAGRVGDGAAAPGGGDGEAEAEEDTNFKLNHRYRPILFAEFMGPGELLVVERPLIDVLATLPPALFKPKYGT